MPSAVAASRRRRPPSPPIKPKAIQKRRILRPRGPKQEMSEGARKLSLKHGDPSDLDMPDNTELDDDSEFSVENQSDVGDNDCLKEEESEDEDDDDDVGDNTIRIQEPLDISTLPDWIPANKFQQKLLNLISATMREMMRSTQVILAAPAERTPVAPGVFLVLTRFDRKILTQIILKGIPANVQEALRSDNVTIESLRNLPTKRRKMCWGVYLHILEPDNGPTGGYTGSSVAKGGVWSRISCHRLNIQAGLTVSLHYLFAEKHGRCPRNFILLAIFPMDGPRLTCIVLD
ncbi:hypothetical protein B0T18DRAFT_402075 [Schizothecium vesticola]|uniref:Uncharacterized protein n=1 Tax=Schizothecium vesticola TaxID=314040 RepID=A0AA40KA08_9PEZI|nr:hypothetical protein B0T18DRAFT_402075 [Schizothecium vesticola]